MDPIDSFPMSANRDSHSFLLPQRTSKRSGGVAIASIFRSRFTIRRPDTFCSTSCSPNGVLESAVLSQLTCRTPCNVAMWRRVYWKHCRNISARNGRRRLRTHTLHRHGTVLEPCCNAKLRELMLSSTVLVEGFVIDCLGRIVKKRNVHLFFPFGMLIWFSTHTTNSFRHGGEFFHPRRSFCFPTPRPRRWDFSSKFFLCPENCNSQLTGAAS